MTAACTALLDAKTHEAPSKSRVGRHVASSAGVVAVRKRAGHEDETTDSNISAASGDWDSESSTLSGRQPMKLPPKPQQQQPLPAWMQHGRPTAQLPAKQPRQHAAKGKGLCDFKAIENRAVASVVCDYRASLRSKGMSVMSQVAVAGRQGEAGSPPPCPGVAPAAPPTWSQAGRWRHPQGGTCASAIASPQAPGRVVTPPPGLEGHEEQFGAGRGDEPSFPDAAREHHARIMKLAMQESAWNARSGLWKAQAERAEAIDKQVPMKVQISTYTLPYEKDSSIWISETMRF